MEDVKYLMHVVSQKMFFADFWIDRISEGKVRWIKSDEVTIKYLNEKYNWAFEAINRFNEVYDPKDPGNQLWAISFLELINSNLEDFRIALLNSVYSLKALGV